MAKSLTKEVKEIENVEYVESKKEENPLGVYSCGCPVQDVGVQLRICPEHRCP